MKLIGKTYITIDPCDCRPEPYNHGHIRYLHYDTRKNSRKYRKKGGPKTYKTVHHDFCLNNYKIPQWLGSFLCGHKEIFNKKLVDYSREEIRE